MEKSKNTGKTVGFVGKRFIVVDGRPEERLVAVIGTLAYVHSRPRTWRRGRQVAGKATIMRTNQIFKTEAAAMQSLKGKPIWYISGSDEKVKQGRAVLREDGSFWNRTLAGYHVPGRAHETRTGAEKELKARLRREMNSYLRRARSLSRKILALPGKPKKTRKRKKG